MAPQSRRADPPLEQVLFEEGYRFEFFQAVRVLERLYSARLPIGRNSIPSNEVVRFRTLLSLSFPPSPVHDVARADNGVSPPEMVVAFMGLFGLMGVLPRHYTELLLERVRYKDSALRDFLDLFNHRMISLFYRAWEKYRFPVAYERSRSSARDGYDPFSLSLFDVIGMGTNGLRGKLKSGDEALLYYSGLVAQQPRSASALDFHLVVLDPGREIALSRDRARPDKNVAHLWVHMEDSLRRELAGLGLWINSADLTVEDTVELILRARLEALIS